MEGLEGLLKNLKLSEVKRGIKVGGGDVKAGSPRDPQAMAKLFSEKPASPNMLVQALWCVWCPSKGISCKELGENHFLFPFHQANGMKFDVWKGFTSRGEI